MFGKINKNIMVRNKVIVMVRFFILVTSIPRKLSEEIGCDHLPNKNPEINS
jgi:hypothetical protein